MRALRELFRSVVVFGVIALMFPSGGEPLLSIEWRQQSAGGQASFGKGAANWPRFRGPASNPVSDSPGLPVRWSKTENVEWVADVPGVGWSSPVVWGKRIFMTAGTPGESNRPIAAIRAGGSGDITPPEPENKNEYVVWYDRLAGGTYLPTPVIYGSALYAVTDKGILSRHNALTGERAYRSRISPEASAFTASPWAYNAKIFVLSEEGDTFVIDTTEEYKLLGVNSLGEFSLASPAIVGDRLLIRTRNHIYSIRNRKNGTNGVGPR